MSSRHHISRAIALFFGAAQNNAAYGGLIGVPFTPLYLHEFGTPAAAVATALLSAATAAELPNIGTINYVFPAASASPQDGALNSGVLDVARNLVLNVTHASAIVAMTAQVTGTDIYGAVISELFTITATGTTKTATGLKAFKTVTNVAVASAGNSQANTLNLGTGVALGLPFRVDENGMLGAKVDGAIDAAVFVEAVTATATSSTGDVRGTVQFASAPDGVKKLAAYLKIADASSKAGAYGVTQA